MTTTTPTAEREFTAFVADAGPRLHRTARLLTGDTHRADELVQATLVKTYLAWPRAVATDPEAYARRVLANQRIDTWRKGRREVLTDPVDVPDTPSRAPSPADGAADRDEVVRALMTLTPRQRRIVVLRHLVGLTDAEVAADLGVSVGTVKSTASRALVQLRHVLVPERLADGTGEPPAAGAPGRVPSAPALIARAGAVRRRRRLASVAAASLAVVAIVVGAVGLLGRNPASPGGGASLADWPYYATLAELTDASDVVVEGTVLDARREEIDIDLGPAVDLQMFEVYRVEVTEGFAGDAAAGDVVEVGSWLPPGDPPDADVLLEVGETYVLFLGDSFDGRPRSTLNPFQAVYRVTADGLVPVSTDPSAALVLTRADLEVLEP